VERYNRALALPLPYTRFEVAQRSIEPAQFLHELRIHRLAATRTMACTEW
jgi:hypothetical protein